MKNACGFALALNIILIAGSAYGSQLVPATDCSQDLSDQIAAGLDVGDLDGDGVTNTTDDTQIFLNDHCGQAATPPSGTVVNTSTPNSLGAAHYVIPITAAAFSIVGNNAVVDSSSLGVNDGSVEVGP